MNEYDAMMCIRKFVVKNLKMLIKLNFALTHEQG